MRTDESLALCLRRFAARLPPKGTKHRKKYYAVLGAFTNSDDRTIERWVHETKPIQPRGLPKLKVCFFFEYLGNTIDTLEELRKNDDAFYYLAELLALNIVTLDHAKSYLGYDDSNSILRLASREGNCTPQRLIRLREYIDSFSSEIVTSRERAREEIHDALKVVFGDEHITEMREGSALEPRVSVREKTEEVALPARDLTTIAKKDDVFDKAALMRSIVHMAWAIHHLARHAVERFDAADREQLRDLAVSRDGKTTALSEAGSLLNALCSEDARMLRSIEKGEA